jgi:hypothetical protein
MKRPVSLLLCSLLSVQFAWAGDPFGWDAMPRTAYPGAFWFCMGSAFTPEELELNIKGLSQAGIKTLRLDALYPAKDSKVPNIPFLSEDWIKTLKAALASAASNGVTLDLWGNGWPFGGPWIAPENAARRLEWDPVQSGLVLSETKTIEQDNGYPIIAVDVTAPGAKDGKATAITPREVDGNKVWLVPPGEWDVYVFRNGFTKMAVKRATTGGEGPVVDHLSKAALEDYLRPYNHLMDSIGDGALGCSHFDSYEVYQANWTGGFLDFFASHRGYDLAPFLPALISEAESDLARRIRHDYRQTLEEMFVGEFLAPWVDWARSRGMKASIQAHGSPGHLVDLYGLADQPDTEAFGREGMASKGDDGKNGGYLFGKFSASAAHLNGRPFTSSETFTWLEDHFCESLDRMRNDLDYFFLAGVNHMYFHSCTYSPSDVPFPGWLYYASTNVDPCQPWWKHLPHLTEYTARVQSVLQSGKPGEDVLLLYPIHDLWFDNRGATNLLQYCQAHNTTNWLFTVGKPAGDTAQWLWDHGWKFDWCSDRTIAEQVKVEKDGTLVCGDGRYRALVIPECNWVASETPRAIRSLVAEGAHVCVIGSAPQPVPVGAPKETLKQWSEKERLAALDPKVAPGQGEKLARLGQVSDLGSALADAGAEREPMADRGILSIRRQFWGGKAWFLKNVSEKDFKGWLPLSAKSGSVVLGYPVHGSQGPVPSRDNNGRIEAYLHLAPTETCLLLAGNQKAEAVHAPSPDNKERKTMEITGPWKLTWDDLQGAKHEQEILDLISWTQVPGLEFFSGTITCEAEFKVEADQAGQEWLLDLGVLHESADVRVNGGAIGCVWTRPYIIDIRKTLRTGKNVLAIEVTNLLANRIIAQERSGNHIRDRHLFVNYAYQPFDAETWTPLPSGLLGPVRVLPKAAALQP